ncbi:IS5 family transposase [Amycolatopsis thermalba]|uniref:IS5 family transposase n=1 Tax=Amycolatopsis thermalba TaxID=944492 RepID=A0ABY4NSU9_9PSEU|nr:IS5 family transposase [Amycolatopsis thermalba]
MGRGEVTDRAWAWIEPLLPPVSGRGRRWRDHRQVLNAILWKLRTGAPWRDLPERYGPWKTAHERLRLWTADGTWQKILDEVIVKDDSVGEVEWVISVDSSVVRAHQHAAGARKKGAAPGVEALAVDGEGLGRSRGGLSTKIHLAVDGRGLPMRVLLTGGHAGDNPQLLPLLDGIAVARIGPGRPRCRPDRVVADKAYSHPSTRQAMRDRRIRFVSPEREDQIARRVARGSRGGRPPAFDAETYKRRNMVERCFNRLKQFRDLATRYAKRAAYYQAELTIAAIILWLR